MKKRSYIHIAIIALLSITACTPEDSSSPAPEDIFVKYFGEGGSESVSDIQPYNDGFLVFGSTDINGTSEFYLIYTDNRGNEISKEIVSGFDPSARVFTGSSDAPEVSSEPERMLVHNAGSGDVVSLVGTSTIKLFPEINLSINRLVVVNFGLVGVESGFGEPTQRVYPSFRDIDFDNANLSDTLNYLAEFNSEGADLVKQGNDLVILGTTEDVSEKGLVNGDDPKDMWLIRVASDLNGDLIWQRKYGFEGEDIGVAIETNNLGYAIVGSTELRVDGNGGLNVLYYPTDRDGFVLDNKSYGTSADDVPTDLVVVNGTSPIILGTRNNGSSFILSAISGAFNESISDQDLSNITGSQNDATFNGNSALRFIQRQNGDFFVVGQVFNLQSDGTNKNAEMILYGVDQSGIVDSTTVQTFGGIGSDAATAVIQNADRTLMIGGTTDFQGNTTLMTLIKTDTRGRLVK